VADREQADDSELRDAALHRGFRLVKSRRRKAGSGDYGKFGLVDAGGQQVFGFEADGLTASADDIRGYLRKGEASTWAASAREVGSKADGKRDRPKKPAPQRSPARPRDKPVAKAPEPPPKIVPPPRLIIRKAKAADTEAIAALVASIHGGAQDAIAERFSSVARSAPLMVAERGGVIGCVQWQVLSTLDEGPVGRILLVVVAQNERRRGVGRMLIDSASEALASEGCGRIEVMSDIDIRNVHGFFEALAFERASYRFVRPIDPG